MQSEATIPRKTFSLSSTLEKGNVVDLTDMCYQPPLPLSPTQHWLFVELWVGANRFAIKRYMPCLDRDAFWLFYDNQYDLGPLFSVHPSVNELSDEQVIDWLAHEAELPSLLYVPYVPTGKYISRADQNYLKRSLQIMRATR